MKRLTILARETFPADNIDLRAHFSGWSRAGFIRRQFEIRQRQIISIDWIMPHLSAKWVKTCKKGDSLEMTVSVFSNQKA